MKEIIGKPKSVNNIEIRLTSERWGHIVESHDYMAGCVNLLFETISDPDFKLKVKKVNYLPIDYIKRHI